MTLAVLITEVFDLEIENEKLTFSITVPPGYFLSISQYDLLLSSPTESFSNLIISLATCPLGLRMIPIR